MYKTTQRENFSVSIPAVLKQAVKNYGISEKRSLSSSAEFILARGLESIQAEKEILKKSKQEKKAVS